MNSCFRSRIRSGSSAVDVHQQQDNNISSSRDTKEAREGSGSDEMWAPGNLSHHRELPVDVPDTLLQQAYPSKVKKDLPVRRSGSRHPRSDSDLFPTLKNQSERSIFKIEISVENDKTNSVIHHSEDDDSERKVKVQKETSVDVEDDYPFAKEDYPTMLKSCSDDSASPRSSSGRSDSIATLDASLIPGKGSPYDDRRIDLGSPCRPMLPEIKVAPLFRSNTTSFDNPAYGLADFSDLRGYLMRSDEVTDLTMLIDEQIIKSPKKKKSNDYLDDVINNSINGSTDNLLESETLPAKSPKKKAQQQSSSGYSTLRSEASGDLSSSYPYMVLNNKSYREVAVDCPPDFVPVTKSHPVYPPPKSPARNESRVSVDVTDSANCQVAMRPADQRSDKVRSKVKSLFVDSLTFLRHKRHSLLHAYATDHTNPAFINANQNKFLSPNDKHKIFQEDSVALVRWSSTGDIQFRVLQDSTLDLEFHEFEQEKNQNSRNSLCDIVDNVTGEESPRAQNEQNKKRSVEYRRARSSSLESLSKSDASFSNLTMSKVQSWLSDPHLVSQHKIARRSTGGVVQVKWSSRTKRLRTTFASFAV